jgi:hypothetical protein
VSLQRAADILKWRKSSGADECVENFLGDIERGMSAIIVNERTTVVTFKHVRQRWQ